MARTLQGLRLRGRHSMGRRIAWNAGGLRRAKRPMQDAKRQRGRCLGELGGSLPTTIGAMALGQEYAVAPLGARIAAMVPNVSKYISAGEGLAPWLMRAGGRLAGYAGEGAVSNEMQTGSDRSGPVGGSEEWRDDWWASRAGW